MTCPIPLGAGTVPSTAGTAASTVSVVLTLTGAGALPLATLAALRQQATPPLEVIVVGAGRAGARLAPAVGAAVEHDPRFRFVVAPRGAARARSRAAAAARGELIAFLGATDVPDREWVQALLAAVRERPDAGLVRPLVLPASTSGPDGAGAAPSTADRLDGVGGFAVPAAVLRRLGGFDDGLDARRWAGGTGTTGADRDLLVRLAQQGLAVVDQRGAVVRRETGRAIGKSGRAGLARGFAVGAVRAQHLLARSGAPAGGGDVQVSPVILGRPRGPVRDRAARPGRFGQGGFGRGRFALGCRVGAAVGFVVHPLYRVIAP